MGDTLLKLYHHLPTPMRYLGASLWGLYLRSWRYGPETEHLVEEALERDYWSQEQWKKWQEERLSYVLHRAATRVPYYRKQWAERRQRGDRKSWEYLENWPTLDKELLRENPTAFVADDCDIRRMFHEHTSGTTGKPLDLWWSHDTVKAWYALFEARCRHWYGISRHDRWAILGGQVITPAGQRRPPFWVWNAPLRQLYMSSYHLAPDLIPHYLRALKQYRITNILGYTSSLYCIGQEVLRLGRNDLQMAVAITSAEPVFDYQRQTISKAFQCPMSETYGMAEIVTAGSQCTGGQLHLWPEVGWVEILEDNLSVRRGNVGDLVCTGILNADMPLIRYRVDDRGALATSMGRCTCGRSLPTLASIEGRADDVLYSSDGRRIGRLDPIFKANLPLREAQIIQEALSRVRVRYVAMPDFTSEAERSIIDRVKARMGPVEVILEPVDKVPRAANGKFRAVVCNLSPSERALLE